MTEVNKTANTGSEAGEAKKKETHGSEAWAWVKSLLSALVIALLIREFILQAFTIPTGSMESTMLVGDHLFVNKLSYGLKLPFTTKKLVEWGNLERGQIIVFLPPQDKDKVFVKRCIGVPGDTIEIKNKDLFINGERQNEPYKKHIYMEIYSASQNARDNFKAFIVPRKGDTLEIKGEEVLFNGKKISDDAQKNIYYSLLLNIPKRDSPDGIYAMEQDYYFMMGDNRDNSNDSRFWGFVPKDRLIGRPLLVWMPLDRFGLPPK